jgi:hypothetical protein
MPNDRRRAYNSAANADDLLQEAYDARRRKIAYRTTKH